MTIEQQCKRTMIKVGDRIALSSFEDAIWWEVLEVDGYQLTIREDGTDYKEQYTDCCFVRKLRVRKDGDL